MPGGTTSHAGRNYLTSQANYLTCRAQLSDLPGRNHLTYQAYPTSQARVPDTRRSYLVHRRNYLVCPGAVHPCGSAWMGAHGVADLAAQPRLGFPRAVGAAVEPALHLDTMPQNAALTVLAYRREPLSGTLNAVERVGVTARGAHLKGHPVVVAADIAPRHAPSVRARQAGGQLEAAIWLDQVVANVPSVRAGEMPANSSRHNA